MTVWFPSETIRYRGVVEFTVPTVSLSRRTDSFSGYEIPLMDTFSDPFSSEVLLVIAFIVLFTPVSDVLVIGAYVVAVVAFTVRLFVGAAQPAANINPIAIPRAHSTILFIGGSFTQLLIFI
jgi:hypothetical protein